MLNLLLSLKNFNKLYKDQIILSHIVKKKININKLNIFSLKLIRNNWK